MQQRSTRSATPERPSERIAAHVAKPRARRDDTPLLARHFVDKYTQSMNKKITRIEPSAMNLLQNYEWPGNVRELENAVERAMVVAREPELREEDFALKLTTMVAGGRSLDDIEKAHILRVLEECSYNQTRTAEVLHIDRATLHNKLKRYGWARP